MLFFVFSGAYYSEHQLKFLILKSIFCIINISVRALLWRKLLPEVTFKVVPYLIWLFVCGQLYVEIISVTEVVSPSALVGWEAFVLFTLYIGLPVDLIIVITLSITSIVGHSLVVTLTTLGKPEEQLFDYDTTVSTHVWRSSNNPHITSVSQ